MKEETNPTRMKAEADYGAASEKTWMEVHGGFARDMTLRDHYAGQAMQGLLGDHVRNFDLLAIEAYQMADAMLRERSEK